MIMMFEDVDSYSYTDAFFEMQILFCMQNSYFEQVQQFV